MNKHYRVATSAPLQKISAALIAGAIVSILVWVLQAYAGVDMPEHVVSAITTLIAALVAWLTPLQPGEIEPVAHEG